MSNLVKDGDVSLARRLDVLIFLQLDQRYPSMREKIEKLSASGLNSGEIGQIVGKPANYVTARLSQGKKHKGKGKQ
jgi:DNA-directed RNA polymerase specialized sigma24 family protein